MPNAKPPSLAASALKFILIFGSGAAAWALLMRWLNREEATEGEQPQAALPASPMAGFMPMPMPVPYPFAVPQFAQPQPAPPPARNRAYEDDVEDEEPPKRRRRRNVSNRKPYSEMTPDEVFDDHMNKILKKAAKAKAEAVFEESELLSDFLDSN